VTNTSTSIEFATPRRLGQAVAGALFVGAVALAHAGLASAQPVDTTKKWNSDEMSACVEAGIDRGVGSTFEGLNGLIFDCCLAAGGNPTYDHGPNSTVTCPEAAANGSQQQPGRPALQQGLPPVLSNPPTSTKPVPTKAPVRGQVSR
jgi:hypothetical protein